MLLFLEKCMGGNICILISFPWARGCCVHVSLVLKAKPKKPVLIIKPKKNRKTGKPPKPILVVLLMMQLHQEIVLLVKGDLTVQRLV